MPTRAQARQSHKNEGRYKVQFQRTQIINDDSSTCPDCGGSGEGKWGGTCRSCGGGGDIGDGPEDHGEDERYAREVEEREEFPYH